MNDDGFVMDVTLTDAIAYLRDPDYRVSVLDLLGVGPAAIPALFPDRPCRPSRRCTQ